MGGDGLPLGDLVEGVAGELGDDGLWVLDIGFFDDDGLSAPGFAGFL